MHNTPLVILAAGKSSRFFPLADTQHKGFYTIAGKSLIEHTLLSAYRAGVRTAFVVVSAQLSAIAKTTYFIHLPEDLRLTVVIQPTPLGMGDALLQLGSQLPEHFFVASPYHISCEPVLKRLYKKQQETTCSCVLAGEATEYPERYGIIEHVDDRVTQLQEKPKPGETNSNIKISSIYLLSAKYLETLASTKQSEYSFETALNTHAANEKVCWIKNDHNLPTLKYSWQLLDLMQLVLSRQKSDRTTHAAIAKTAVLDETLGSIVVADSAEIRDFVKIIGPAYIGEDVLVGEHSFIRQSSLEHNASIGAYTEVVRSLICPEATIHQSYLADSILGPKTTIGAGLVTANKRFDRKKIALTVKNRTIESGKTTLGLITGNAVTIGVQVASMPGTLIASNAVIFPNNTASGTIEKHTSTNTQ